MATLFTKIRTGEIPGDVLYQDETCFAIRDIKPEAPRHLLVIPVKEIPAVDAATAEHKTILGHCLLVAAELARREGIAKTGYRLVINNGADAGQSVDHIHVHVLGGREMKWPPG